MWIFFFFSSRRRHTRYWRDWSSDVCSSDLEARGEVDVEHAARPVLDVGRALTRRALPLKAFSHAPRLGDRKSTRLNSSHANISYAVFCLKKKKNETDARRRSVLCIRAESTDTEHA